MADYYIGLMSGTSLDCIDAVLVDFDGGVMRLCDSLNAELPDSLRADIYQLMASGDHEIERLGITDRAFAYCQAKAVKQLLAQNNLSPIDITAIGSHGQTIRHHPSSDNRPAEQAFTLQIGDPNTIAYETGITTVADFRRKDLAAGGQGAPLAPAFHRFLCKHRHSGIAICNIGGFSNPTLICDDEISGFDSGPGNVLLDGWIDRYQQKRYDSNGDWARSGTIDHDLLTSLLSDEYFALAAPKSTGREYFNLTWLDNKLTALQRQVAPQDVQRSLLELTAHSIADSIQQHRISTDTLYICGGGAHNTFLLERIADLLPGHLVETSDALGLDPDWVEACAFAWLGFQTINHRSGNCSSVTGAKQETILGGIYFP